jgi:hypothetical protein
MADGLDRDAEGLDSTVPIIESTAERLRANATTLRILHEEFAPPPEPEPPPDELPVFPGVNPLGITFNNLANVPLYAKPTSLLIAGRCSTHSDNPAYREVRAGGGEVLQYLVATERPNSRVCEKDMQYYRDCSTVPLWPYPKGAPGTRCKYPNTKMTDMRAGSEWIIYTVGFIEKMMRLGNADGVFLDAMGARPWNPVAEWSTWSLEEKNAYTLGCVDLCRRVYARRNAVAPNFIIVSNGTWDRGDGYQGGFEAEKYVDGIMIEHHASTSAYHRKYATKAFGDGRHRRVLIIGMSQADAVEWAKAPGVTHVSGQRGEQYGNPLPPPIASWSLDDRKAPSDPYCAPSHYSEPIGGER